jgi:hypothetical protein
VPVSLPDKLRQELFKLDLQCLNDQSLGAFAQHRAQQILPFWLTQWNYRMLAHGGVTPLIAEIRLRHSNSSRSRRLLQLIVVHQIRL